MLRSGWRWWWCAAGGTGVELLYDAIAALPGYFIDQPRRLGRKAGRTEFLERQIPTPGNTEAPQPSQANTKLADFIFIERLFSLSLAWLMVAG